MALNGPESSSKENLRASILEYVGKAFRDKLIAEAGATRDSAVGEDVAAKFEQTFSNCLETAFDFIFRQELVSTTSTTTTSEELPEGRESECGGRSAADLSVNDDELQEMDNAINSVSHSRKFFPARCSLFLDKTLRLKLDTAAKIQSKSAETVARLAIDGSGPKDEDNTDEVILDEVESLQSELRQRTNKAVKVERTLKMLLKIHEEEEERNKQV